MKLFLMKVVFTTCTPRSVSEALASASSMFCCILFPGVHELLFLHLFLHGVATGFSDPASVAIFHLSIVRQAFHHLEYLHLSCGTLLATFDQVFFFS